MDKQILEDCDRLALEGKLSFPESIQRMASTGVERYRADLVRMEKMHYSADGESIAVSTGLTAVPPTADEFNSVAVQEALRAIQGGKIDYGEFLRRIMQAGCTDYGVWLKGRKAIYFGRSGDFYVENFPSKK